MYLTIVKIHHVLLINYHTKNNMILKPRNEVLELRCVLLNLVNVGKYPTPSVNTDLLLTILFLCDRGQKI
jgi:hypothetical protein